MESKAVFCPGSFGARGSQVVLKGAYDGPGD